MILTTRRLTQRPWEEGDAEVLYEYARDPRVGPAAGWPPHRNAGESLEIIRTVFSAPETYALVETAGGQVVGCAGIKPPRENMEDREREIGCWVGVPHWGKGFAPEAVTALLHRCFGELDCSGVWYAYFQGNEKSRRVMEKCGFLPHHTTENVDCPLIGEVRREHLAYLSRERWEALGR